MSDTSPLVSVSWLAEHLGEPGLTVLDIRSAVDGGGRPAYEAGHIPGALHTDYVQDGWRAARGRAAGLLPEVADLESLFGSLGLSPDEHIVVAPAGVSGGDFSAAARVFWTLKVAGHQRLSLLDGGTAAWEEAGQPLESGHGPSRTPTRYSVRLAGGFHSNLEAVSQVVAEGSAALVDSRGRAFFEGRAQSPQAARAGRLPGALLPAEPGAYDGIRNRLRPPEQLEHIYATLPEGPAVTYCNTGHAAATDWFALSQVLGRPGISLYDGSMSEWTQDPDRPVETGPA